MEIQGVEADVVLIKLEGPVRDLLVSSRGEKRVHLEDHQGVVIPELLAGHHRQLVVVDCECLDLMVVLHTEDVQRTLLHHLASLRTEDSQLEVRGSDADKDLSGRTELGVIQPKDIQTNFLPWTAPPAP